jgi:hypothetical protein
MLQIDPDIQHQLGDKTKLQIIGTGNVKMAFMVDGKVVKCTIKNVLHVPSLGYDLLSVGAMESKGMTASFGGGGCSIFAASKKIAQGTRIGNIYMWMLLLILVSVARPLFRWKRGMRDLVIPIFGVLRT